MTDLHKRREPTPHLHTRPATMLTAIGLCVLILIMQLLPHIEATQAPATTTVSSVR